MRVSSHLGAVYSRGVNDRSIPLTSTVDYPTYDALAAATIAGGAFATCRAAGVFRWEVSRSAM